MINYIRELVAGKDLMELDRWRSKWQTYRGWLNEFPMIAMTLDNMNAEVRGGETFDACYPPGSKGPWVIDGLRYLLRKNDPLKQAQIKAIEAEARLAVAEREKAEAVELLMQKNREVNELRFVCGEAYQLAKGYKKVNIKGLENLYAASKGIPLPHSSFMKKESVNG